jgi:N-acyl-D-aspartate/D-glutamate deacylase
MSTSITRRNFIKTTSIVGTGLFLGMSMKHGFDLIIKNGLIVDGSGSKPYKADIGIINDLIYTIGDLSEAAAHNIIDAANQIVCPGFIDIHTHTDIELLVNNHAESKIHQGVTTEVSGNCGSSPFPFNQSDAKDYSSYQNKRYGIDIYWQNLDGFFEAIEKNKTSINYATFTGHGDLRAFVVGKNDVTPSSEEMKKMQSVLRETMEMGSLGLATGLEYAPSSYGNTDELIELCKVVSKHNGVYATHMRNEDDTVIEAVEEALEICREANVSLQISHLKSCNKSNWHKTEKFLKQIHSAYDKGLSVNADRYPYVAYGTGMSTFLPIDTRQGSTDEIVARLEDNSKSSAINEYISSRGDRIGGWDRYMISYCASEKNKNYEGKTIQQCASSNGTDEVTFIRELLVEERLGAGIVGFAMDEGNLHTVLKDPLVSIGSDGSAKAPHGKLSSGNPHPRFYGTHTRVLGKYCREEKLFDIQTAVKKMTSMPAEKLGIKNRGLLKRRNFADVVVFDPNTVIDNATFEKPHQYPSGISYVIVNGKITVEDNEHTGAVNGKVLRHNA